MVRFDEAVSKVAVISVKICLASTHRYTVEKSRERNYSLSYIQPRLKDL